MAKASCSMVEKLRSLGSNLLLAKAMGCFIPLTSCNRIAPIPSADASVYKMNGLFTSGKHNTACVHTCPFRAWNACSWVSVHTILFGEPFLVRSVNGAAISLTCAFVWKQLRAMWPDFPQIKHLTLFWPVLLKDLLCLRGDLLGEFDLLPLLAVNDALCASSCCSASLPSSSKSFIALSFKKTSTDFEHVARKRSGISRVRLLDFFQVNPTHKIILKSNNELRRWLSRFRPTLIELLTITVGSHCVSLQ